MRLKLKYPLDASITTHDIIIKKQMCRALLDADNKMVAFGVMLDKVNWTWIRSDFRV